MNIGEEIRRHEIKPLELPIPKRETVHEPDTAPVQPQEEPVYTTDH